MITPGILTALEAGFWPRLMGLLARVPEASVEHVAKLALRTPISLALGHEEAAELLHLAHTAQHTAARWLSGEEIIAAAVPYLPIPSVPLAQIARIGQTEAGEALYVFGGRIFQAGRAEHVTAGLEHPLPKLSDLSAGLEAYAGEIGSDSPGLADFVEDLADQVDLEETFGSAWSILPDWLVRRAGEL